MSSTTSTYSIVTSTVHTTGRILATTKDMSSPSSSPSVATAFHRQYPNHTGVSQLRFQGIAMNAAAAAARAGHDKQPPCPFNDSLAYPHSRGGMSSFNDRNNYLIVPTTTATATASNNISNDMPKLLSSPLRQRPSGVRKMPSSDATALRRAPANAHMYSRAVRRSTSIDSIHRHFSDNHQRAPEHRVSRVCLPEMDFGSDLLSAFDSIGKSSSLMSCDANDTANTKRDDTIANKSPELPHHLSSIKSTSSSLHSTTSAPAAIFDTTTTTTTSTTSTSNLPSHSSEKHIPVVTKVDRLSRFLIPSMHFSDNKALDAMFAELKSTAKGDTDEPVEEEQLTSSNELYAIQDHPTSQSNDLSRNNTATTTATNQQHRGADNTHRHPRDLASLHLSPLHIPSLSQDEHNGATIPLEASISQMHRMTPTKSFTSDDDYYPSTPSTANEETPRRRVGRLSRFQLPSFSLDLGVNFDTSFLPIGRNGEGRLYRRESSKQLRGGKRQSPDQSTTPSPDDDTDYPVDANEQYRLAVSLLERRKTRIKAGHRYQHRVSPSKSSSNYSQDSHASSSTLSPSTLHNSPILDNQFNTSDSNDYDDYDDDDDAVSQMLSSRSRSSTFDVHSSMNNSNNSNNNSIDYNCSILSSTSSLVHSYDSILGGGGGGRTNTPHTSISSRKFSSHCDAADDYSSRPSTSTQETSFTECTSPLDLSTITSNSDTGSHNNNNNRSLLDLSTRSSSQESRTKRSFGFLELSRGLTPLSPINLLGSPKRMDDEDEVASSSPSYFKRTFRSNSADHQSRTPLQNGDQRRRAYRFANLYKEIAQMETGLNDWLSDTQTHRVIPNTPYAHPTLSKGHYATIPE